MVERTNYLKKVFGFAKKGWHAQVLQTYEGLQRKGVMLPEMNMKESSQLLRERLKFHYDILGQTSMKGAYGVANYFQLLPVVVKSIELNIKAIHQILKPIPNECDLRFENLVGKIPVLKQEYACRS